LSYTCRLPGKAKRAPFLALIKEKGVPFGHSPEQTQALKALIKEKGAPFLALLEEFKPG